MSFFEQVYTVVRKIPAGKVATYGQIANILSKPNSARVVGWALNKNPDNKITPCHRVVNKKGQISKAFAFGGINMQKNLLKKEGVNFTSEHIVDLNNHLWNNNEK